MKTRKLGKTGLDLTEISFGTAPLGNLYHPVSDEAAKATIEAAWEGGIRFFDTAPYYGAGLAEERLGRFLVTKPRDSFVISTKVGRLVRPVSREAAGSYGFVDAHPAIIDYDYSRDGILRSIEASRKRTGLDRFDILLVHDIGELTHGREANDAHMRAFLDSGVAALEELKASGDIAAWGLGVNENKVCIDIMAHARLDCILLAGRYTLLDRTSESELRGLCRRDGTMLLVGGVFNSGILATGPIEGATFDYTEASKDIRARVAAMQQIMVEEGSDIAAAALNFPLDDDLTASVLIGTAKPSSLTRNLAVYGHPPSSEAYAKAEPFALR